MAFLIEKGHIPKDELRSVYHSKFRRTAIVISNKWGDLNFSTKN